LTKLNLSISKTLLLFFIFFSVGNFFGLFIKSSYNQLQYIILLLLISELISYLQLNNKDSFIFYYINICKRGFLVGIFVEAFKVGS
jgi:uncharacterized membrane protein YoaK (UPF0700 family)